MLKGNPFVVQGFHIPTDNPIFLIILSIHIVTAFTCVVAGAIAMFAEKRPGLHPKAGNVYYYGLWIVFITVIIIAIARWKEDYHLFILGSLTFIAAFIGHRARKQLWQKWSIIHIICMSISYIILITAFYVDNGKFLPIWKNLPVIIYWLLPTIVGVPFIIRTLFHHPLSRKYFERD